MCFFSFFKISSALEFSDSILDDNKAAGLLVRLNAQGNPIGLDGNSDLDGIKVVDVKGFAPTAENLALLTNHCTGQKFVNYNFVPPNAETDLPNDDALRTLLDGDADAMFVCKYIYYSVVEGKSREM